MLIGADFDVQFPVGFDLTALAIGDISMTVGGGAATLAATAAAGTWGVSIAGQDVTFETPTDGGVASSTELVITIGQEGGNMITNPTATTSYEITVSGSMQDSGQTRVAIIDNVLVTANINTTLTFTISGTSTGATVNGSATTTFADSTSTALPFGTLSSGVSKTLAQDLTVATNAINGYVVTVEQDSQLQSSTGADIDGFADGAWDTDPVAWTAPSNSITDEDTWGHWGLTSTDGTANRGGGSNEFGSDEWVAASTTPINVMYHDGPADGVTEDIGRATVGYQIQITALQEAGDDYNTTLTYIATPTF